LGLNGLRIGSLGGTRAGGRPGGLTNVTVEKDAATPAGFAIACPLEIVRTLKVNGSRIVTGLPEEGAAVAFGSAAFKLAPGAISTMHTTVPMSKRPHA
jgi:hypothetical protein